MADVAARRTVGTIPFVGIGRSATSFIATRGLELPIRALVLLAAPPLLLPAMLLEPDKPAVGRTAWVMLLMAAYWAFEALPIAVTSLLPLVLFPLLGVLSASHVSVLYFKDSNWLFFGGLVVAAALEAVRMHERIALRVLLLFGTKPHQLLLGFMVATSFLSMWMNNTATTAMMMPIAEAVLGQLDSISRASRPVEARLTHTATQHAAQHANVQHANAQHANAQHANAQHANAQHANAQHANALQHTNALDHAADGPAGVQAPEPGPKAAARAAPALRMGKALMLGVAWAANIGGMATLTGTGPNIVLAGALEGLFPKAPSLSFATWFAFAAPCACVILLCTWLLLLLVFVPREGQLYDASRTRDVIRRQQEALGPASWREQLVFGAFVALALLWITRHPGFVQGWDALFTPGFVTDGTSAIAVSVLLFALPGTPPWWCVRIGRRLSRASRRLVSGGRRFVSGRSRARTMSQMCGGELAGTGVGALARKPPIAEQALAADVPRSDDVATDGDVFGTARAPAAAAPVQPQRAGAAPERLVSWSEIESRLPWGVLLLLGGGFALADACMVSGLSALLGENLEWLRPLPRAVSLLLLMCIVSLVTAVTSNTATASIFLPVVAGLSHSMQVHPLYLLVPVTLTTSLAFVLPVSTPPNALAFASGRIKVGDMAPLGLCVNAIGILVVLFMTSTTGRWLFDLGEPPEWAGSMDDDE